MVSAAEDNAVFLPIIVTSRTSTEPPSCYHLTLTHTGQGSDPTASPDKSAGCEENQSYIHGEFITLRDALPDSDWIISGWTGTHDDTAVDAINSLTMPAGDHAAGVNYAFSPFAHCAFGTGNNATIGVPGDIAVTGYVLVPDDEIAVFTSEGICAGKVTWTGSNIIITAWGDDDQTPEKDGLTPGEMMAFRILDHSSAELHTNISATFSLDTSGDGSYMIDGIYLVSSISANEPAR